MLSLKVWFVYARHVLLFGLSSAILECENAAKLVQRLRGFQVDLHSIGLSYIYSWNTLYLLHFQSVYFFLTVCGSVPWSPDRILSRGYQTTNG